MESKLSRFGCTLSVRMNIRDGHGKISLVRVCWMDTEYQGPKTPLKEGRYIGWRSVYLGQSVSLRVFDARFSLRVWNRKFE